MIIQGNTPFQIKAPFQPNSIQSPIPAAKPKTVVKPPETGLPRFMNYYADYSGCGHWRMIWPEQIMNAHSKAVVHGTTVMNGDPRYYGGVKGVRIQRQATPQQLEFVKFLRNIADKTGMRLIYEIDDKDGWQIVFFIQGQAGTGKSTYVLNVCKQFYEDEDVGIMSNNIQRQFGLSDLVDKMIYIAPEIKRDFSMEQGEFQSIVSGDKVTINIKFKQSRFETWKIPGVLAGNESPDFIDNSGSIQRRIVSIKFTEKVKEGDLMLGKKLRDELPNILQKCNKIYLEKSLKHGRSNIWTVLPKYFENTRDLLAQATNPLIHFLCSGKLEFGKDLYIPEKTFVQLFNTHCNDNNYSRHRFNPDFYMGPFYQKNITVQLASRKKYPKDTHLTRDEFCSRLMTMRDSILINKLFI